MNINNNKRFMTVAEVAELFGCNIHQIYKIINSGELRCITLGRKMIAKEWIEEFIENQSNTTERSVQ